MTIPSIRVGLLMAFIMKLVLISGQSGPDDDGSLYEIPHDVTARSSDGQPGEERPPFTYLANWNKYAEEVIIKTTYIKLNTYSIINHKEFQTDINKVWFNQGKSAWQTVLGSFNPHFRGQQAAQTGLSWLVLIITVPTRSSLTYTWTDHLPGHWSTVQVKDLEQRSNSEKLTEAEHSRTPSYAYSSAVSDDIGN